MIESRFPTSWIFLTFFASGIITQKFVPVPAAYLFPIFAFSSVILLSLAVKIKKTSNWFAVIFIFIAGVFCAGKTGIGYEKQIPFSPEKVRAITGEIADVKEKGTLLILTIKDTTFSNGNRWVKSGLSVRTYLRRNEEVYESDWILIDRISSIKIEKNQISVHASNWKIIEPLSIYGRFRCKTQAFSENITRKWFRYHGQAAAIFQMIVLGNSRQSLEIKNIFIQTGTYHLLIVSGIHLGYLLFFLKILVFPIRRFEQTHYKIFNIFYLAAIVFYSAITGFNTPVVRAALMFGIYLFSEIIERPVSSLDSIGWAGSIILFSNPDNLFNMGFQLSFAATTGIVLAMKNLPAIKRLPTWLDSMIRANIGAQFFTVPVLVGNIGTFYPSGFVANLFLVPFGGIVVGLGFVFLIVVFLRQLVILPLIKFLELFWMGTKLFSMVSPAICWNPGILMVTVIYLLVFAVIFRNRWKLFVVSAVFFAIIWIGFNALNRPHAEKKPHYISGDQEDIIIFPCKKLLCLIEKENSAVVLLSMKENSSGIASVIKKIKSTGKDVVFIFVDYDHDIFEELSTILQEIKPVAIVDSPDIRKHPAFGYRKCFILGKKNIKQKFWDFLVPFEGIRVIYNRKNSVVLEYKNRGETTIISTYLNSRIFEVLPFSPEYHTVYATQIALSKKLAEYLQEYGTRRLVYQKLIYATEGNNADFEIIEMGKNSVSLH